MRAKFVSAPRSSERLVYWDASAVLSWLLADANSARAERASAVGAQLLSSLAFAEVQAVLARIERRGADAAALAARGRLLLEAGGWRELSAEPDRGVVLEMAARWRLRGADLWHLALAKTLWNERRELVLLSFDAALAAAAEGEGMAAKF